MFQAQQNYMIYPQFGTVNFLSNFNHNTWHSGNIAIEKRYGNGLIFNTSYNLSKSLSNDDSLTYYNRQGKARTPYDSRHQFGAFLVYELPVGKGKKWMNQGGFMNSVFGGWKVAITENINSGVPISVTHAGSPNRYLTAVARQSDDKDRRCRGTRLGHGPKVPDGSADALLQYEFVCLPGCLYDRVFGITRAAGARAVSGCSVSRRRAGVRWERRFMLSFRR